MPAYDYRCRTCDVLFEVRRGLDEAPRPAPCPSGHGETSRVFTPVSVGGSSAPAGSAPSSSAPSGGGCCGGGCCG